ncbi:MAG: hypothetical protein J6Q83_06585 [Clostridia bacterium]|nr:hypothetical protein [Clostridia bacterium]
MKKNDNKNNQRTKSVVLLLLVTIVLIGLVSSTAIKLASATYLMQKTQKPIITIPKIIEEFIDIVTPTSAPTTQAPAPAPAPAPTTKAPTTQAPTEAPTQAPTTQAPTTQAPTTEPVTEDPDAGIKRDQAIYNSYKTIVERAKRSSIAYTKTTNRTLSMSFFQSLAVSGAENLEIDGVKYFNNPITTEGVANADKDFIINNKAACLIDGSDLQATSAAISSTSREVLKDGSVKLVINFNDEANPKVLGYDDVATEGFINGVLPVVTAEQVRHYADDELGTDIESLDLYYTGCYVELVYKPATGEIISLKQVANYDVDGKDGFKSVGGTITEINTYTFG